MCAIRERMIEDMIQELLGHQSPQTTARYTHLTDKGFHTLIETVNHLMADL